MDVDNSSDSDSDSSTSSSHAVHAALTASSQLSNLGGSVSRSARLRATTTDNEEDDDDEEDDEEEDDESRDQMRNSLASNSRSKLNSTSRPSTSSSFVTASRGERYLLASSKPAKTSSSKLSDALSGKPVNQKELLALLARHRASSRKGKATERQLREIEQAYMQLFPQFAAELRQGYKLLFYGLGSKIRLLNLFAQISLRVPASEERVVLFDGFRADASILDLVTVLERTLIPEQEILDDPSFYGARSAARLDDRIIALLSRLDSSTRMSPAHPIYILLHSIDGPALRSPRAQATIWTLSNHPCVRLTASFDHAKAPLLFPKSTSSSSILTSSSPAIYHHTPTLRPYTIEALQSGCTSALLPQEIFLSDLQLLQGKQGGIRYASSASRAKAAAFVLASLTQKAKDLFQLIAARQLGAQDLGAPGGAQASQETPAFAMPYPVVFAAARDAFLANNAGQMEALLREFRDHQIVMSSSVAPAEGDWEVEQTVVADLGQKGSEWLWINIDAPDLQDLSDKLNV